MKKIRLNKYQILVKQKLINIQEKNIFIDYTDFKVKDLSDKFMTFTKLLNNDNPNVVKYRELKFG